RFAAMAFSSALGSTTGSVGAFSFSASASPSAAARFLPRFAGAFFAGAAVEAAGWVAMALVSAAAILSADMGAVVVVVAMLSTFWAAARAPDKKVVRAD